MRSAILHRRGVATSIVPPIPIQEAALPTLAIVLALLSALATPAAARLAPSDALARIAHADSLSIERVVFGRTGDPGAPQIWEAYSLCATAGQRVVSGDLCRRLAERIVHGGTLAEGRDCAPVCSSCPSQLVVRLDVAAGRDTISASVYFRERDLRIRAGDAPVAYRALGAEADSLLALVREAMPDDPGVQAADSRRWLAVAPDRALDEGDFVDVDDLPLAVKMVPPVYPERARDAGVEGQVMVKALLGTDGRVERIVISKSVPALDEAAAAAVRKWRFSPARCGGRPVAIWVAVPVKFTLH